MRRYAHAKREHFISSVNIFPSSIENCGNFIVLTAGLSSSTAFSSNSLYSHTSLTRPSSVCSSDQSPSFNSLVHETWTGASASCSHSAVWSMRVPYYGISYRDSAMKSREYCSISLDEVSRGLSLSCGNSDQTDDQLLVQPFPQADYTFSFSTLVYSCCSASAYS